MEFSDAGHWRREDEPHEVDDGDGRYLDRGELIANLRRVTLTPRTHPLGGDGAHLGAMNVRGEIYKAGEGIDLSDEEVRPSNFLLLAFV